MPDTTIKVSKDTREAVARYKAATGLKNTDEVIRKLLELNMPKPKEED